MKNSPKIKNFELEVQWFLNHSEILKRKCKGAVKNEATGSICFEFSHSNIKMKPFSVVACNKLKQNALVFTVRLWVELKSKM
jgi:hypothetical protein